MATPTTPRLPATPTLGPVLWDTLPKRPSFLTENYRIISGRLSSEQRWNNALMNIQRTPHAEDGVIHKEFDEESTEVNKYISELRGHCKIVQAEIQKLQILTDGQVGGRRKQNKTRRRNRM
jgi:hypothetical protein